MSSKLGEALVGSEITRDHQRKMGEAGSSTDQLCSCVVLPEISSQGSEHSVSCPRFCACLMPEIYHTGYLQTPLCPSEPTHPPMTFSEDFSEFSERPHLLPSLALRLTPHSESVHQLRSPSDLSEFSKRPLRVLQATSPSSPSDLSESRSSDFSQLQSWLPSFGSCFSVASLVRKRHLGLLHVVRHEVIGFFHPTLLLFLVVEFSTHFYSLFRLP